MPLRTIPLFPELETSEPDISQDMLSLRIAEEWVTSNAVRSRYMSRVRSAKRRADDVRACRRICARTTHQATTPRRPGARC